MKSTLFSAVLLLFMAFPSIAQNVGEDHFQINAGMDLYHSRNRNPVTTREFNSHRPGYELLYSRPIYTRIRF